jgi:hypothetical protein
MIDTCRGSARLLIGITWIQQHAPCIATDPPPRGGFDPLWGLGTPSGAPRAPLQTPKTARRPRPTAIDTRVRGQPRVVFVQAAIHTLTIAHSRHPPSPVGLISRRAKEVFIGVGHPENTVPDHQNLVGLHRKSGNRLPRGAHNVGSVVASVFRASRAYERVCIGCFGSCLCEKWPRGRRTLGLPSAESIAAFSRSRGFKAFFVSLIICLKRFAVALRFAAASRIWSQLLG